MDDRSTIDDDVMIDTDDDVMTDIDGKSWRKGRKLVEGGFGCVHECVDNNCAVIKLFDRDSSSSISSVEREKIFYCCVPDTIECVPKLLGFGQDKLSNSFIVLERFDMDFYQFMSDKRSTDDDVRFVIKSTIDALECVHDIGFVHCDIKAKNILLRLDDSNKITKVVLADFGLSCMYQQYESRRHRSNNNPTIYIGKRVCGTNAFMSCAAHRGFASTLDPLSDMESLGWNIIEWFGGVLPWRKRSTMSNRDILRAKLKILCRDIEEIEMNAETVRYFDLLISNKTDDPYIVRYDKYRACFH